MQTNKRNLPKVYSGLQLAISIISCFLRQSFFFSKHSEDFSQHSQPNKAKNWHRLPRQMPIRCYPLEGQSWTNKSNRKQLTISVHGKNSISCFVIKQRRLETMKTTFRTHDQTSYVLNKQIQQHGEGALNCWVKLILSEIHRLN